MGQLEVTNEVVTRWAALRPETDLTALQVVQRLLWCGRLTEDLLERAAQAAGLRKRGDYEVISLLRRSEPSLLTPNEVADLLLASASGMTAKLDRLEQLGFLRRTPDNADRRVVRLTLTDSGREAADNSFDIGLGLFETMLSELNQRERQELDDALSTILARLDRMRRVPRPWETES